MNNLIAIVGMCGSGKSTATAFFKENGYKVIYFGEVTINKLIEENLKINSENEQMMRERLREELGMGAYAIILLEEIKKSLENNNVVLDGVYSWSELKILNDNFPNLKVIAIVTDRNLRYSRLKKRNNRPFTDDESEKRDISEIENIEKGGPIAYADYYITNNSDINEYSKRLEYLYNTIEKRN